MNTQLIALVLTFFLGFACSPSSSSSKEKPEEFSARESRQTPLSFKVNVYLQTPEGTAQSTVFCFSDVLHLEKRPHVMVNSTRFGPIGVKEVIDALRIAPGEEPKGGGGRDQFVGSLKPREDDLIQVVWKPGQDLYQLSLVTAKSAMCGESHPGPVSQQGESLLLSGAEVCAPITFRRSTRNEGQVDVYVGEACQTRQVR